MSDAVDRAMEAARREAILNNTIEAATKALCQPKPDGRQSFAITAELLELLQLAFPECHDIGTQLRHMTALSCYHLSLWMRHRSTGEYLVANNRISTMALSPMEFPTGLELHYAFDAARRRLRRECDEINKRVFWATRAEIKEDRRRNEAEPSHAPSIVSAGPDGVEVRNDWGTSRIRNEWGFGPPGREMDEWGNPEQANQAINDGVELAGSAVGSPEAARTATDNLVVRRPAAPPELVADEPIEIMLDVG